MLYTSLYRGEFFRIWKAFRQSLSNKLVNFLINIIAYDNSKWIFAVIC